MKMLAPIPSGVLTRRDDPTTPADERLHDQRSRDVGVNGNITNWPVLSLFGGVVLTAADRKDGYGLAARIEGEVILSKEKILLAHEPWPMKQLMKDDRWLELPEPWLFTIKVRALYAHANELWCVKGQNVQLFQPLMGMGNTGKSNGNHLHLKLRLLDLPEPLCFVDPLPLFR